MRSLILLLTLAAMSVGMPACGSRSVEQSPDAVEHDGPTIESRLAALVVADRMLTQIDTAVDDTQTLFGAIQTTQAGSKQLIDLPLIKKTIEQLRASMPRESDGRWVSRVPITGSPFEFAELSMVGDTTDIVLTKGDSRVSLLQALQKETDVQLKFGTASLVHTLTQELLPGCSVAMSGERTISCSGIPLDLSNGLVLVVTKSLLSMKAGTAPVVETALYKDGVKQ